MIVLDPPLDTEQGMRLDRFLAQRLPQMSRTRLADLIKSGCVFLQGAPKSSPLPKQNVQCNQIWCIEEPPPQKSYLTPWENCPFQILYEDDDVIVIDKPAGMIVHPGAGNKTQTLVHGVLAHCQGSLSGIGGTERPGIVHRIDKETSGLLVMAKNDLAHQHLAEQFSNHSIERIYTAFVWGYIPQESGTIETWIGQDKNHFDRRAVVKQGGKWAITHYRRQKVYPHMRACQIQCFLETGRTHQIRVHMAYIGHSLIGDKTYGVIPRGSPPELVHFPRQALHAGTLGFIHPRTGEKMSFSSALPADLTELDAYLQQN